MFRKNQNHLWGFQSTLPARGATAPEMSPFAPVCISIHAPRTGSDRTLYRYLMLSYIISIHAPRTGSDCQPFQTPPTHQRISIHAPRTGSDSTVSDTAHASTHFNPRSPHGERRRCRRFQALPLSDFNPRSPHGERQSAGADGAGRLQISIHAPRTGSDNSGGHGFLSRWQFQSTLPARGATSWQKIFPT